MSEHDLIEAIARRMWYSHPGSWDDIRQSLLDKAEAAVTVIEDAGYVVVKKDEAQP